jgi:hypothetical protein
VLVALTVELSSYMSTCTTVCATTGSDCQSVTITLAAVRRSSGAQSALVM